MVIILSEGLKGALIRRGLAKMKIWKGLAFYRSSNKKYPQWISRSNNRDYKYPTEKFPALNPNIPLMIYSLANYTLN